MKETPYYIITINQLTIFSVNTGNFPEETFSVFESSCHQLLPV